MLTSQQKSLNIGGFNSACSFSRKGVLGAVSPLLCGVVGFYVERPRKYRTGNAARTPKLLLLTQAKPVSVYAPLSLSRAVERGSLEISGAERITLDRITVTSRFFEAS